MLIYKQRYKPRTSRVFTKSDLTVYDSAGNTALNALTVYGKSEVVDGTIKSAGEGYAVVDLGTLNWTQWGDAFYTADITDKVNGSIFICSKYPTGPVIGTTTNKIISGNSSNKNVYVRDTDYTDATTFKNSLNGVLLCYQLADPTQGNTIAIKTDDGSGINGTMAVFSTGTPLRDIPDSNVRDAMTWDGSAGTVTNVCGGVDLGTLTWTYAESQAGTPMFISNDAVGAKAPYDYASVPNILCAKYPRVSWNAFNIGANPPKAITIFTQNASIRITDTDYTDATAFKNSLNGVKLVYELATPTTQPLSSTENASIAGLRTFAPSTHAQNNAGAEMTVDYTIRVPTI